MQSLAQQKTLFKAWSVCTPNGPWGRKSLQLSRVELSIQYFTYLLNLDSMPYQGTIRNRVRDDILVSMAGPASNVVICLLMVFIGGVLLKFVPAIAGLLGQVILLNCVLIIFNMIPIPPLDGSHLLKHAVGMRDETYLNFARWGFLILIILINIPAFRQVFGAAIYFSAEFFYKLMLLIVG